MCCPIIPSRSFGYVLKAPSWFRGNLLGESVKTNPRPAVRWTPWETSSIRPWWTAEAFQLSWCRLQHVTTKSYITSTEREREREGGDTVRLKPGQRDTKRSRHRLRCILNTEFGDLKRKVPTKLYVLAQSGDRGTSLHIGLQKKRPQGDGMLSMMVQSLIQKSLRMVMLYLLIVTKPGIYPKLGFTMGKNVSKDKIVLWDFGWFNR